MNHGQSQGVQLGVGGTKVVWTGLHQPSEKGQKSNQRGVDRRCIRIRECDWSGVVDERDLIHPGYISVPLFDHVV